MSAFGIYILNFLHEDPNFREARLKIHRIQLQWWIDNTEFPIHVIAMNYKDGDKVIHPRITYYDRDPARTNISWRYRFDAFYASDHDFGIMLDDDSMLYDLPQHKEGYKIFEQMATHLDDYRLIDCFYPIAPNRMGFNPLWNVEPELYEHNHIFHRDVGLKGSMFVVRNFQKEGKTPVYNDPRFTMCEDHKFSTDLVAAGYTVYRCNNIVLKELNMGYSHFGHGKDLCEGRREPIDAANAVLVEQYELDGIKRRGSQMVRKGFIEKYWRAPTRIIVPKYGTQSQLELFEGTVNVYPKYKAVPMRVKKKESGTLDPGLWE